MSAAWNDEQREWLQAMGFDVLAPAAAAATAPAPHEARAASVAEEVDEAGVQAVAFARATPDLTDPLLRALLRASRCDDVDALARCAGDLAALRRSPADKRALWPTLRAWRVRSRR